jgi:hypothetical protein
MRGAYVTDQACRADQQETLQVKPRNGDIIMYKQPPAVAPSKASQTFLPLAGTIIAFITLMTVGAIGAAMVMAM